MHPKRCFVVILPSLSHCSTDLSRQRTECSDKSLLYRLVSNGAGSSSRKCRRCNCVSAAFVIAKTKLFYTNRASDLPLDFSPWCENGLLLLSASPAVRSGRGNIRLD